MNKKSITKIEDAAVRMIFEGTASETGERFFMALVENLAKTLTIRSGHHSTGSGGNAWPGPGSR